jgi:hypothetical protein
MYAKGYNYQMLFLNCTIFNLKKIKHFLNLAVKRLFWIHAA